MLKAVMRLTKEIPDFEGGLVLNIPASMVVILNLIFFSPTV